jgi:hypothetical protein
MSLNKIIANTETIRLELLKALSGAGEPPGPFKEELDELLDSLRPSNLEAESPPVLGILGGKAALGRALALRLAKGRGAELRLLGAGEDLKRRNPSVLKSAAFKIVKEPPKYPDYPIKLRILDDFGMVMLMIALHRKSADFADLKREDVLKARWDLTSSEKASAEAMGTLRSILEGAGEEAFDPPIPFEGLGERREAGGPSAEAEGPSGPASSGDQGFGDQGFGDQGFLEEAGEIKGDDKGPYLHPWPPGGFYRLNKSVNEKPVNWLHKSKLDKIYWPYFPKTLERDSPAGRARFLSFLWGNLGALTRLYEESLKVFISLKGKSVFYAGGELLEQESWGLSQRPGGVLGSFGAPYLRVMDEDGETFELSLEFLNMAALEISVSAVEAFPKGLFSGADLLVFPDHKGSFRLYSPAVLEDEKAFGAAFEALKSNLIFEKALEKGRFQALLITLEAERLLREVPDETERPVLKLYDPSEAGLGEGAAEMWDPQGEGEWPEDRDFVKYFGEGFEGDPWESEGELKAEAGSGRRGTPRSGGKRIAFPKPSDLVKTRDPEASRDHPPHSGSALGEAARVFAETVLGKNPQDRLGKLDRLGVVLMGAEKILFSDPPLSREALGERLDQTLRPFSRFYHESYPESMPDFPYFSPTPRIFWDMDPEDLPPDFYLELPDASRAFAALDEGQGCPNFEDEAEAEGQIQDPREDGTQDRTEDPAEELSKLISQNHSGMERWSSVHLGPIPPDGKAPSPYPEGRGPGLDPGAGSPWRGPIGGVSVVAKNAPGEGENPRGPLNFVYGKSPSGPSSEADGELSEGEDGLLVIEGFRLNLDPEEPRIAEQRFVNEKYRKRAETLLLDFSSIRATGEFFNQRSRALECVLICPLGSVMRMENWFKEALVGNLKVTELLQRLSPKILKVMEKLRSERSRPAFNKGIMSEKDGLFKILKSLADLMKIHNDLQNEDLTSLKRNRPLF